MKRKLSFVLVLCMIFTLTPTVFAADGGIPEGTPIYEPGIVMELDFGTFTVLDAGFTKKVELFYTQNTQTVTKNGTTETKVKINEFYHTAKDGFALFVVKGILHNTSRETLSSLDLQPAISNGMKDTIPLVAYPAVPLSGSASSLTGVVTEIEPGSTININFSCTVPNALYFGRADILFAFCGTSLGFQKEVLKSYVSMGFEEADGVLTEDVTALIDENKAAIDENNKEQEIPHIDELTVEDVALEYDSKNQQYNINVKVRNINYPTFEGRHIGSVRVHFRLLDKNGDAVPANRSEIFGYEDLQKGRAGWGPYVMSGSGTHVPIDRAAIDTAYSIIFDSYEIRSTTDSESRSKSIKGTLTNPPVFLIDDILPNRPDAQKVSDSDAVAVEGVSVEFTDALPTDITTNTAYTAGIGRFNYSLKSSETYAAISFTVTNMTKQDIFIGDMDGDFVVELNYDDGFIYSTESNSVHFVQCGREIAVINHDGSRSSRIGDKIALAPLVSADVIMYLPCAKLVATQSERPLVVSFHTTQTGNKQIDIKVR